MISRAGLTVGDVFWAIYDDSGELCKVISMGGGDTPGGDVPGGGGSGRGGSTMGGGMSGAGGTPEEDDGLYSLNTLTVATVTSQEQMTVSVSVDELDVMRLYVGQSATVTMNAVAAEPVEAVIRSISNEGENDGGNSKFTVEFVLEKSGQMLPGMNATATVILDTARDVLCVPAAAVYERDGKLLVYTGCDEKSGQLTDPVEVSIGSADADYVQIVSGLSTGTRVWYETYRASTGFPMPTGGGSAATL